MQRLMISIVIPRMDSKGECLVAKLTASAGTIALDPSQPHGQARWRVDTTRAEREFGFKARAPLTEGLRKTVDCYKQTQL